MRTRIAPVNQKKELARALKPYKRYNDWIKTRDCFLNREEIGLVSLYLHTGSYSICASVLKISLVDAANKLIKIILRLNTQLPFYQEWEKHDLALHKNLSRQLKALKAQSAVPHKEAPDPPPK
jgi:hypothetical protein